MAAEDRPSASSTPKRLPPFELLLGLLVVTAGISADIAATTSARASAAAHRGLNTGAIDPAAVAPAAAQPNADAPIGGTWLPALGSAEGLSICDAWIDIQHVGAEPASPVLAAWTEDADDCAPTDLRCGPLLAGGGSWRVDATLLGPDALSGVVFTIAHTAPEAGRPGEPSSADLACADLVSLRGDCAAWRAWLVAIGAGGAVGQPLPAGPRLAEAPAVRVGRECPIGNTNDSLRSSYSGFSLSAMGAPATDGRWHYTLEARAPSSADSVLYVLQAIDLTGADVQVAVAPGDACGEPRACTTAELGHGLASWLSMEDCVDASGGLLHLSASAPVAILRVESHFDATLQVGTAHAAWPDRPTSIDPLPDTPTMLYAPLAYDPSNGRDTRIIARNRGSESSNVRLRLLDAAGGTIAEREQPVCPGGIASLYVYADDIRSGIRLASARIEGTGALDGEIELTRPALPGRASFLEAQSYPMVRGHVGPLAVPRLVSDLGCSGMTSELTLLSTAEDEGVTDVVIAMLDQNAVVDVLCRRLHPGRPVMIDPQLQQTPGFGFQGSALVSAAAWTHLAPPGLAVVLSQRDWALLGMNGPGDEVDAVVGIPMAGAAAHLSAAANLCVRSRRPEAVSVPHPAGASSATALDARFLIPLLDDQGLDDECQARIEMTNPGGREQRYLLLAWDRNDGLGCEPNGPVPSEVRCSGPVAPGASWVIAPEPGRAWVSAVVLVVDGTATVPAEDGRPGGILAEELCAWAESHIVEGRGVSELLRAWDAGGALEAVPAGSAGRIDLGTSPGGSASIAIVRDCPTGRRSGARIQTDYRAHSATSTERWMHSNWIFADVAVNGQTFSTIFAIQNAGVRCTDVTLHFRERPSCFDQVQCTVRGLEPGASIIVDAEDYVGPGLIGTLRVHATEPLAVIASTAGLLATRDVRLWPGEVSFDFDGSGRVDGDDLAEVEARQGIAEGDPAWDERYDTMPDGLIDSTDLLAVRDAWCLRIPSEPDAPTPAAQHATVLALPALGQGDDEPGCAVEVMLLNLAEEPLTPLWVGQGAPGAPPDCEGPSALFCGPLLAPGGMWRRSMDEDTAHRSALVFGLRDVTMREIGRPSDDRNVAEVLCASASDFRCKPNQWVAFLEAVEQRGVWAGIPLGAALGGPLAASIRRTCRDVDTAAVLGGQYSTSSMPAEGAAREGEPAYLAFAPSLYARAASFNSRLHVQNVGSKTVRPTISLRYRGSCNPARRCELPGDGSIGPGEVASLSLSACGLSEWQGSAVLSSTQPVALLVETTGRGTHADTMAPTTRGARSGLEVGWTHLAGWLPDVHRGADTLVQVHSVATDRRARVRVRYLDERGAPWMVLDAWICPQSTQSFFHPVRSRQPGESYGSGQVEVESLPAHDGAPAAPVRAVMMAVTYPNSGRFPTVGSGMLALWPSRASGDPAPPDDRAGATAGPHSAWVLPGISSGRRPTEQQLLSVSAADDSSGSVDVSVRLWDGADVVAERCLRLDAGQARLVDLTTDLPRDFRGAAIVSAVSWTPATWSPSLSVAALRTGPERTLDGTGQDAIELNGGLPLPQNHAWLAGLPAACPAGPEPTPAPTERPLVRPAASATATASATAIATAIPSETPVAGRRLWLPWGSVTREVRALK